MANEPQSRAGKAAPPAIDQNTAGWIITLSKLIFSNRKVLLIVFILITALLAAMASQLRVQAGFTKMIPLNHPYMSTFLQ